MSLSPHRQTPTPRCLTRIAGALVAAALASAAPAAAAQPWDAARDRNRSFEQTRPDGQPMPRCMCEARRQWREEARQSNQPRGRMLGDAGRSPRQQWRQAARDEMAVRATDRLAWRDTRQLRLDPNLNRRDRSYIRDVRWQAALDTPEIATDVRSDEISVEGRIREIQRPGKLVHGLQFVRITLDDGAEHLLALQPDAAARMELARGQTISMKGSGIAFGNEQAVIVREAELAGQTFEMDPGSSAAETDRADLEGRVQDLQRSDRLVHGYILYRIRLQDGREQVLAVHPDDASKLQFKQGDEIRIGGTRLNFGTEEAIIVEEVSSGADQVGSR